MIQKESVLSWFKGLSADDRIDVMCNLLDCCIPWEIRFLSTFIEAQVQRDYPAFRQPESTANNPTDLSCLSCLHDVHVRRKLCVSLALLHSSNRQAAAVLFGILNDFQPSSLAEEEFFTDLSLLMTMSAHHPAFSFHQKHTIRAKLKQLKQSANQTSDLSETVSESSSGSSTFSVDHDVPARFETQDDLLHQQQQYKESLEENATMKEVKKVELAQDIPPVKDKTPDPQVYVKEIKVQAIEKIKEKKSRHELRKRDDHRYVLQVSWCDNTTEIIHRTYEEMFDFQCKLRKMYPNKVDESGNPWKLPFLPGRIRLFNKPEQKGEKTPIPDISDYTRLFSNLPKFVRGCDHVVKFFQSDKRTRKKSDCKKAKGSTKKEVQSDKVNQREFETPHKLAEAVREQSLGGKDNMKSLDVTNTKKQSQNNVADEEELVTGLDENGNEVKVSPENSKEKEESKESLLKEKQGKNGFVKILPSKTLLPSSSSSALSAGTLLTTSQSSLTFKPLITTAMPSNMLHMLTSNGLHSSLPSSLTSLQLTMPSSPVTSYPSPPSSNGSPVTSPASSPSFPRQRSCSGNVNWTFRHRSRAMTVSEWLRNLRLHKYSEVFKGKTFDEMLKLSDEDFEKLGLTAGARKKIRVNLEVLRTSGCFTSNGLTIMDILSSPPSDLTPFQTPTFSKGILIPSSLAVHPPAVSHNSDSEFLHSVSESDSASDCGSDVLSEPGTQTGCSNIYPRKFAVLNGCRLSCYNCGSLGHVGQQCMAPNLDKKPTSYGPHFRYDGQLEC